VKRLGCCGYVLLARYVLTLNFITTRFDACTAPRHSIYDVRKVSSVDLPACGKVDQSEAIFICTLMQAVLAYRWLMYGFPANFYVRVSHHQLHVITWAGCVCPLQLFKKLIFGLL
jgi:hypothetical protein